MQKAEKDFLFGIAIVFLGYILPQYALTIGVLYCVFDYIAKKYN